MASDSREVDLFELTLHGGPPERRYRNLRPDDEATFPWGTLDKSGFSAAEIAAARLGWTEGALQEYASAGAHAHMVRELVRARVPLDLSAVASRFPLDELAHAPSCARAWPLSWAARRRWHTARRSSSARQSAPRTASSPPPAW